MSHYLGTEGCTYIVGLPFSDEDGEHTTGEEYSAEQANKLHYLEAFVSSGRLYRVWDAEDYGQLPPHVFNAVQTRQEAEAKIEGDSSHTETRLNWEKPEQLEQSEKEAEVQEQIHQLVLDHAAQARDKAGLTDGEKVLLAEREQKSEVETEDTDGTTDGRIRQSTAKKTAAKKAAAKRA